MHLLVRLRHLVVSLILASSSSIFCTAASTGFFVWPSSWVVVNNASLPSISSGYQTMDGPFRLIIASSGDAILSPSNTSYGFGFIKLNSTGEFILSVAVGVGFQAPPASAVWIANADRPVKENATLRIGPSGNMVLLDWDGTEVWNSGEGEVRAVAMRRYGQLEFFNSTNSSAPGYPVWRSWTSPTQRALVQGQALPTGSKLVSNVSATNSSEGMYSLVMEPAGMVLYTGEGAISQPYWRFGLLGFDDYASIRQPCFLNASDSSSDDPTSILTNSGQLLNLSYAGDGTNATARCPAVNSSSSTSMLFGTPEDSIYRFVRLDADGNLRGYKRAPSTGQGSTNEWAVDYELFRQGSDQECRLPNVCGAYGVCAGGQCSCPGSGSVDAFPQRNPLNAREGCLPPRPLLCNGTSAVDHYFMKLQDVNYFLNSFSDPELNVSTVEQCKSLCSSNCSCEAFFFHHNSSSCFQATALRSLVFVPGSNFTTYLKVQNASITPAPATFPAGESSPTLGKGGVAGIAVGTAVAVFSLMLAALLIIVRRRSADGVVFVDPDEEEERAFLEALPGLPPRFTLKEMRVATGEFMKRLGVGGFGTVYEGVLKDGSRVAVKRLNGARQGHKEFRAEVATIGSINHVNLVRLRGFCAEKGERLLIYELVENGSLDKWIFRPGQASTQDEQQEQAPLLGRGLPAEAADGNLQAAPGSSSTLSWERRLGIAIGAAKGLAYLHEDCRSAILHLDIKPQNILLTDSFVPKVGDFGMARLMERDATQVVTAVRGTPGYLAPEWLLASIATKKCDVYSFGMLLLELVSGRRNFDPTVGSDPSLYYFPAWAKLRALEGKYMDLLDERIRRKSSSAADEMKEKAAVQQEEDEIVRLINVAFCCIHEDPRMRPSMGAVVRMLEGHDHIHIPTLAALGLTVKEGGHIEELTEEPYWALLTDDQCSSYLRIPTYSSLSDMQLSGPR